MHQLIYFLMLVGCGFYAVLRGGAPERWGTGALLVSVIATPILTLSTFSGFETIEYGIMAADAALFCAVVVIALRAQRYWPLWIAAIMADVLLTHLLVLVPGVVPWSYAVMNAAWNYPIPPILAAAAWRHQSRIRQYGSDPAWNS